MPLRGARFTGDSCHWRCGGNGKAEPLCTAPTPAPELKAQCRSSAPLAVARWVCSLGRLQCMGEAWIFITFSTIHHKIKAIFYVSMSLHYVYCTNTSPTSDAFHTEKNKKQNRTHKIHKNNSLCGIECMILEAHRGLRKQFSHDKILFKELGI
uniref:Sosondowah ankyrin repeat domain family member A n=1 Tax=Rattus norvegicus TaxID=10116 RepID=A0A0G2K6W3_RAT